jgi:NADPH:quinone reductase-like Zn-dependent oxidoreductase
MRAIVGEEFGGYQYLKLTDIPKPAVSDGRVLVRMTAAGVTPLDHIILSGSFPMAKAPLVLGNEGVCQRQQCGHRPACNGINLGSSRRIASEAFA